MKPLALALLLTLPVAFTGCVSSPHAAVFEKSDALQQRSYQTRAFATADQPQTLRAIIATLQDLGFVIDKADATLGSVSGTKLSGYEIRLTVTVRPRQAGQLLVRANAQFKLAPNTSTTAIEDPKPYQDFFAALAKSLFLEAQEV
jgi:hypothetical protein